MSQIKVNAVTDASGGNTATINSMTPTADSLQGFRNRIINGDMRIDQRNAGASGTAVNVYTVDRFFYNASQASKGTWQQNAGSVTPPVGYSKYLGFTSSSAYSVLTADYFGLYQSIEGQNIVDLAWGTANAKTVTLSFWVRSSLTGTFGGSLNNSGYSRSYPFTYTISSANTWEQKSVTIAGDTTGTWLSTNGIGITVNFSLGTGSTYSGTANAWAGALYLSATGATSVVGTNGATFYITGVQLEVGSVATPFERRDYGRELMMCQRYYYKLNGTNGSRYGAGGNFLTTAGQIMIWFPTAMRVAPSALEQTGTATDYQALSSDGSGVNCNSVPEWQGSTAYSGAVILRVASGLVAGNYTMGRVPNTTSFLAWSAEL